ncbi:50S ribosomal protein L3 [candidate division WWE3 bacterium CG08_land_8_20_14_0_20_41_15]|uniref:50S ribosomal protein L3 n=1 Tax=candidate division WWE3 bacterium CG08_land_8_20_14_0_20_41_15 TaxID=1975086 RepID=A0A2H0X8Q9_UNCKA|nr:MAG: 50S ribosomal protein L3 [candidate division WWE3 bacterium CG08_land_8_20_14_0_20_41_15]
MTKIKGIKLEMTRLFSEDGKMSAVTPVKLESVPEDLEAGALVKVTGISKGKGFQGVIKRWHFRGGPKTHGQSDRWRAPGSIGMRTTPGRVWLGKKMPGHMGNETVSTKNIKVFSFDKETSILSIIGAVPGPRGGKVLITY